MQRRKSENNPEDKIRKWAEITSLCINLMRAQIKSENKDWTEKEIKKEIMRRCKIDEVK